MAIQIRRGTDSQWESNYSNIVVGEPAMTTDTERFFIGTGSGTFMELPISKADYLELARLLSDEYDSSATYFAGQFCKRSGYIYEAKADISTPESWTSSHWTQLGSVS